MALARTLTSQEVETKTKSVEQKHQDWPHPYSRTKSILKKKKKYVSGLDKLENFYT